MGGYFLSIAGTMPGLNDYIAAMNRNRHIGNAMKRQETERVASAARAQLRTFSRPIHLSIVYREAHRRRDKDNIAFAKKFILDGLKEAGCIENDGWAHIDSWQESFVVEPNNPGITVVIKELRRSNGD